MSHAKIGLFGQIKSHSNGHPLKKKVGSPDADGPKAEIYPLPLRTAVIRDA